MRGDVYRLKAPKDALGHEQAGVRYAVVVQSDDLPLSTWVIVPTSTSAIPGPIRPEILVDGRATLAMVDQVSAVDPEHRLGVCVGNLAALEMQAIDRALRLVLGLI